jgi:hypothetical protein
VEALHGSKWAAMRSNPLAIGAAAVGIREAGA